MANNENTPPMQTPTPDPALKRLEKLAGTWSLTGRTLNAAEGNITGWTTFEWLPNAHCIFAGGIVQSHQ